jgi:ubiquitin C-terminal hydrolase
MADYIANEELKAECKNWILYDLYRVIYHEGESGRGHYTSICCNDNNWFLFNDNKPIVPVKENKIPTTNAYVLFYKRKDYLDAFIMDLTYALYR